MNKNQRVPLLIYVAGPISADNPEEELENVRMASRATCHIIEMGHHAVCPHLDWHAQQDNWGFDGQIEADLHYGQLMRNDLAILARCDAILYLGGSPGADLERFFAETVQQKAVFTELEDIPTPKELGDSIQED